MQKESYKIAITLFFVLTAVIIYLTVGLESNNNYQIITLEIEGNKHLSQNSYLHYAGLDEQENYKHLTIGLIRDRIQKHPYVLTAMVSVDGKGKVKIELVEKVFKAQVLNGKGKYLLTKNVEILPLLENTQNVNYPVIRLNGETEVLIPLTFPKSNPYLASSYKILSAASLLNPNLYNNLSEIDFRNGKNAVLYFSSVDYPVILGEKNQIKKMVVFEKLWESLSTVQASELLDYVDLRFNNKVYLGLAGEHLQAEETQS